MLTKSLLLILLTFLFSAAAAAQENSINWQKDFKAALKLAQKTNKPLLLDFQAEWCVPCREMDKKLWTKPEAVKLSENFVAVTIEYADDLDTVKLFRVRAIPTVITTDSWGNLLNSHYGFRSADDAAAIIEMMNRAPKDFGEIKEASDTLQKRETLAALIKTAEFYQTQNFNRLSNIFYARALKRKEVSADAVTRENVLFALAENYAKLRDFDEAARIFEQNLNEFPRSAKVEATFANLINAHIERRKFDEAEQVLARMTIKFPASLISLELKQKIAAIKIPIQ